MLLMIVGGISCGEQTPESIAWENGDQLVDIEPTAATLENEADPESRVKTPESTLDVSSNSPSNNGTYTFFAIALALSVFLNLTLLRWYWWRKKLPDDSKVPADVMHQQMNAQTTEFEKLAQVVMESAEVLINTQDKHGQELSGIKDAYSLLQHEISSKNTEIERLREGYDSKILRDFVRRFIRVDIALGEYIERAEDPSLLQEFRELLVDALEECGVKSFEPEIGTNIRSEKVGDWEDVGPAPDAEQEFTITKIIKPGYMLNDAVIVPARVAAFGRFEEINDG